MNITIEQPHHAAAIDSLLDLSFGPERAGKTVYRLREGVSPVPELSLVAVEDDAVVGTIRYWPILIGGVTPTILLGPIAIAPGMRSGGLGAQMIRQSLNRASAAGWRSVVLVGDAPYYSRFGFTRDLTLSMSLPGPVDLNRFLALELVDGALNGVSGMLSRWPTEIQPTLAPEIAASRRGAGAPAFATERWTLNAPA
ncbi:GCN5 family acetyltransferase [Skermanella stibiiresistens SB22]|uniref:GCN5 family acetyltransferase n=1 Tax=Skermanella stibiiresistens SB22 TaxID=1385369 RepID=W9GWY9_9PROT|nr:N-acetyltransferase [Skermanella stibiiresistens]EWY38430.1 GCN5 family acetyltransferase [Skermanella stibiiresistens SB22]